jgi:glycopeptide antibiotics resistance protein
MLRYLIYPFLPYRSFAAPVAAVIVLVAPCWLAFRFYRRRSGEPRLARSREFLLLAFVVYLASLAAVTLTPNYSTRVRAAGSGGIELQPTLASLTCSSARMPVGSRARALCMRNAEGNAVLLFPFGVLLPLAWRHVRFWQGLLIALALSCGIELFQYASSAWGSYRAADVNDIVLNVCGAGIGLALVSLLRWRRAPVARAA